MPANKSPTSESSTVLDVSEACLTVISFEGGSQGLLRAWLSHLFLRITQPNTTGFSTETTNNKGERNVAEVSGEERIISGNPNSRTMHCDKSFTETWTLPPLTDFSNTTPQLKLKMGPQNPIEWIGWQESLKILRIAHQLPNIPSLFAFASSAPSMACASISHEFHVPLEMSAWVTSLYLCGYMAGPLIWGPLSELIGRLPVLLFTFGAYTLLQLGAALAPNLPVLLVSRALSGFFGSGPLTNSGAVLADIWDSAHRVQAISWQVTMPFIGTSLGPVIGIAIDESRLGFRWIFWTIMVLGGATWFLILSTMPETYSPILLVKKAKKLRESTGDIQFYAPHEKADCTVKALLRRTVFRPFEMVLTEPILVLIMAYFSMICGLLYSLFETFPVIWQDLRGFTPHQTSKIFIGVSLGSVLGRYLQLYLARPMKKLIPKWHGHPPCEMNLYGTMFAGPFLVGAIFWLGWTGAYAYIPWWVPALSTIFLGLSFNVAYISMQCYLVDVYLTYAASALAAATICRAFVGAVVPLFTRQMFIGLGTQWACTLTGCFALIICFSPFVFYKYGGRLRSRSKFSQALDLKMKERVEAEEKLEQSKTRDSSYLVGQSSNTKSSV
ncbi:hypothetical protein KEM48_012180 [Puccinia striiformis f. sp. tritici PST-130]|nr:hypothetical protein KEM48_012180 [Puccinia striiformis f. sp. tritici PST-130]